MDDALMTTIPDSSAKPQWAKSRREAENEQRRRDGLPRRRRIWPWIFLLLCIAGAGAFAWWQSQQPRPEVPAEPVPVVESRMQVNADEYATVTPRTLYQTIKVIGTLRPSRQADLSSQTGGLVDVVNARPGDRVSQGDVLVQVDVERITLELDLARSNADASRAQLAFAEGQLERSIALVERGVATASDLEEAQSNVDGLRASLAAQTDQVAAAELTLRDATVTAPFDGIVSARSVDPGTFLSVGTPLMSVVDLETVELQANAPVSSGSLLKPGQIVSVVVDGIDGREFSGQVARINPVAAEGTRTIPVYVTLDNPGGILLGGMFATGNIVVEERQDAIAVPTEALREDAEGPYLLAIEDGTLVRKSVVIAETWEGRLTRIAEGLRPGDVVVTAALPELETGTLVELVEN
jgi:membrane fusion protein, multidrug efflux system